MYRRLRVVPDSPESEESYLLEIKESAIEENPPIRRLVERPGGERVRSYQSESKAELDVYRLSVLSAFSLRKQPSAPQDQSGVDGYLVSTGRETNGYGRQTQESKSGWEGKRRRAIERDEFQCQECGVHGGPNGEAQLHVDHVTPQATGGSDDVENLRTLCRSCHMAKHGSERRHDYADVDEVAPAIQAVFEEMADPPIVLRSTLYDLLCESLETDYPASGVIDEAIADLVKFDAWGRTECSRELERPHGIERVTTYDVVYYEPTVSEADIEAYIETGRHDRQRGGKSAHTVDKPATENKQVTLDLFTEPEIEFSDDHTRIVYQVAEELAAKSSTGIVAVDDVITEVELETRVINDAIDALVMGGQAYEPKDRCIRLI